MTTNQAVTALREAEGRLHLALTEVPADLQATAYEAVAEHLNEVAALVLAGRVSAGQTPRELS